MTRRIPGLLAVLAIGVFGCESSKPIKPDMIRIEAADAISADDGVLAVRARIYEKGTLLHGINLQITLALSNSSGSVTVTNPPIQLSDFLGEASHRYSDLRIASSGTITVEAFKKDGATAYLDANGQPLLATAPVRVESGIAAAIAATLTPRRR